MTVKQASDSAPDETERILDRFEQFREGAKRMSAGNATPTEVVRRYIDMHDASEQA